MAKRLAITESFVVENKVDPSVAKAHLLQEGKMVLMPKIEAIHAGTTANYTRYSEMSLRGVMENHSGVHSWTYPYPKPMLKNHDTWEEPLGRITSAQFVTDSLTGKSAIVVIPTITDPEAIEKILDGRYLTVSIGGETDSAICSICGQDIINDGWCEHNKGQKYEVKGKGLQTCTWEIGELWFHELSFVNVPADENAQVVASGNAVAMECYSYDGKDVTDLQTSKILSKKQLRTEGINLNEFKGGTDKVKITVEELQAKLLEAETNLQDAVTAQDTLKTEVEKLTTEAAEASATIQTLTEEKQALEDASNALKESETNLNSTIQTLTEEKEELTVKVNELTTEKTELMEKNAELNTQIHTSLAERVVDLKRTYGKPGCEDREAAITAHLERSAQSLQDSLNDLLQEGQNIVFKSQIVPNPGYSTVEDKQGAETKEGKENNDPATITTQDVFYGLLTKAQKM